MLNCSACKKEITPIKDYGNSEKPLCYECYSQLGESHNQQATPNLKYRKVVFYILLSVPLFFSIFSGIIIPVSSIIRYLAEINNPYRAELLDGTFLGIVISFPYWIISFIVYFFGRKYLYKGLFPFLLVPVVVLSIFYLILKIKGAL